MKKGLLTLAAMGSCLMVGICCTESFARESATANWHALEVAYARANLELAQARLAEAKSQNQSVRGSVSDGTLDELTAGVQLAQDRLKQLESGRSGDPYAGQIAAAEGALRALEADHDESLKANKIQAGSVADPELRREVAEIAVAKARLAALKVVSQQPPEVRIQWQIGQLQDQIRALWARPLIED
jgi:hypothetical protein